MKAYEGIDFANREENVGRCYVIDDGQQLTTTFTRPDELPIVRTAVDCPLGTTVGFLGLLQGDLPPDDGNGFQLRHTEAWLRDILWDYHTNQYWRNRDRVERRQFPRANYFHPTQHVQPTLGLRMVPACIYWLSENLAPHGTPEERLDALADARRGEASIVEAHPRPFLYSAVERIWRHQQATVTIPVLNHVVGYKKLPSSRSEVYALLCSTNCWMGAAQRVLMPAQLPREVMATDHAFDAWLCALTAWCHDNGETIDWTQVPGLTQESVEIEGHILVLRQ